MVEWILARLQDWAAHETSEETKKKAHRRFNEAVLPLSKSYALASATDEARELRDTIGSSQAVWAEIVKTAREREDQRRARSPGASDCQLVCGFKRSS